MNDLILMGGVAMVFVIMGWQFAQRKRYFASALCIIVSLAAGIEIWVPLLK